QLVVKIGVAKTGVTIDSVFQADPLNTDRQKAVFLFKETDLSIAPGAAGQRRRHRAGKNRKTEISAR
ncbi:hypothetical protein, partial [Enterobacter kobei]